MRVLWKVIAGIVVVLLVVVFIPFTSLGNALIKPYIQDAINTHSPLKLEVTRFELGLSSFGVDVKGEESVSATLNGTYSIFSLSLDSYLHLDVKDLSYASDVAGVELQGAFVADVRASGSMAQLDIVGESNIAQSSTIFLATLKDLNFSTLVLQVENAQLQSLLATVAKPPYAQALLNVDIKLTHDSQGLGGDANIVLKSGQVDGGLIKRDFGVNIPPTQFQGSLLAQFSGENISHDINIKSNLGDITTKGTTNINTFATDSKYFVQLSSLAPLTPIVQMPIRGDLHLSGTVKGDQKSLLIDGDTNLAQSHTTYRVNLVEFAPANIEANIQRLNIQRLLYMLYQPIYTEGSLTLTATLSDFSDGISGQIAFDIPNGKILNSAMKQSFELDMPTTTYSLSAASTLHRGSGEFITSFKSTIANLIIDKADFSLQPKIMLKAPYSLVLHDLSKLEFVSGMPMRGKIDSRGDVELGELGLRASFISYMLGGKVEAVLLNNQFKANLAKLRSEELLRMLTYQPFFISELNGNLEYELLTKLGNLEASLSNGRLAESDLTRLALPILKIDLTREVYQHAQLKTRINDKVLSNDVNLVSNNTTLTTNNAVINTDTQHVDAVLTLSIKDKPTNISITGNVKKPKVSIDRVNQAIEKATQQLQQKIEQGIDKAMDKHLPNLSPEQSDGVKNLLQNIFKKP